MKSRLYGFIVGIALLPMLLVFWLLMLPVALSFPIVALIKPDCVTIKWKEEE